MSKFPIPGLCVTREEIALFAREKVASLSDEEATELLAEVEADEADEADEVFESIPKTAEDQEAFGVGVYQGTQECSRRFNELAEAGLEFDPVMNKIAEEIQQFDAETEAMRSELTADPDDGLLGEMVNKLAEEDPELLAEFAATELAKRGYRLKEADDEEETDPADGAEGVEDEEETEEEAE